MLVVPGHGGPARQGRPRPGRRPAHQHAAHRALPGAAGSRPCTPRCGSTRPPGPTSPCCASRGVDRDRAGQRQADRRGHRQGPAGRPGRDRRPRPAAAGAAGRAAPRTWRGCAWSSRRAAPASRWTRSATWATAPPASRATRWPGSPPQRGAEVTLVAAHTVAICPTRRAPSWCTSGTAEELRTAVHAAAAGRRRGRDGRRRRRLPAGRTAPTTRSRRPTGPRTRSRSTRNADILAELVAKRTAGPGRRRIRRGDRRQQRRRARPRPRQARAQGRGPAGRQRGRRRQGVRGGGQRRLAARVRTAPNSRFRSGPKHGWLPTVWDAVVALRDERWRESVRW